MKTFTKKQKIVILIIAIIVAGAVIWAGIKMLEHQPEVPIQPSAQQPEYQPDIPIVDEKINNQYTNQDFRVVVTGNEMFDNLITKLNTEFTYQQREDKEIRFPQEFFELKEGNQLDFALFTAYTLRTNNLGEAAVMKYKYLDEQNEQKVNTVVVFRGLDLPPKHIVFEPKGVQVFTYGWSFEELFQIEEQRLRITIIGHEVFLLWPLPTADDLWAEQWIKR